MDRIQVVRDGAQTTSGDDLVARLRAGDEGAYEVLVRENAEHLLGTARRLLGSEAEAGDAVQETFLAAFKAMATFDGAAKLSTWLHRIAVNVCLMRLRSQRRRPEELLADLLPDFDDDGGWAEPSGVWGSPVEAQVYGAELRCLVRRCCEALPDGYRQVLMLRLVEGLDTEEVSARLGVTANAVKIRLHRARQALASLLREALGEGAPELSGLDTATSQLTRRAVGE